MSNKVITCSCLLKAINRTSASADCDFYIYKNLTVIKSKISYFYKFVTEYRKLDVISWVCPDLCPYLGQDLPTNPIYAYIHNLYRDALGKENFHKCPYIVSYSN